MLKFMVVLYRRSDLTPAQFRRHLEEVHAPLAKALPGLRKYRQNHVLPDAARNHPGWDAIIELYFDNRASMEAAWAEPARRSFGRRPPAVRRSRSHNLVRRGGSHSAAVKTRK